MLPKNAALKHIALTVNHLDACEAFYHQQEIRCIVLMLLLTIPNDFLSITSQQHT